MAKDLFAVLRQNNELPNLPPSEEESVVVDGSSQMDIFFSEVAWIQKEIEKIRIEIGQVKTKHGEILSALQQNPKTKAQLEELNENIKRSAGKVRVKLKALEQTIKEQEAKDATSADLRIRKTQFVALSQSMASTMHQYGLIQIEHKERCKALLKRQLEVAQWSVTDDELENMLESGNAQIFTQGIITDTQQARQNLADIEARHEDIMKLEKSIRELHDLFVDMAALVETQGELVDRIDINVKQTQDYVAEARQETKKAVIYKKKSRKKKFIIIGVCCAIIVIIIIIVVATIVPRK
ncbi:Syntaxin isoform 2 [Schistosoma japonicum]|uniref:Syntaxin isoform 2 n=1 Tax=Schistosoma japonicum TaxID=6182 RepID=A0A4Z2DF44_SCHJA|nr:Syntaxin isoform 2 [Schistosoma japonicum]